MPTKSIYKKIMDRMVPSESGFTESSEECESLDALIKIFEKEGYVMTQPLVQGLSVLLATIVSVSLPEGEQIWMRIIGQPSSGKTTLAEAVSGAKRYVTPRSKFTGFHSGWSHGGRKSSFLEDLRNKVLIIKDADTIFSSEKKSTILSELRDLYDGDSRSEFRNAIKNIIEDMRMGVVLCGTDTLRTADDTGLGERFLDIEISSEEDQDLILDRVFNNAIANLKVKEKKKSHYKDATVGFVNYLKQQIKEQPIPDPPQSEKRTILQLATLLATARARVYRDKEHLKFRARAEAPYRIVNQLVKLVGCVGFIRGEREYVSEESMAILRKVVFDTAKGFQYDVLKTIIQNPGISSDDLSFEINLPKTNVRRYLDDLQELNAIRRGSRNNGSNQRGRDAHCWYPEDTVAILSDCLE